MTQCLNLASTSPKRAIKAARLNQDRLQGLDLEAAPRPSAVFRPCGDSPPGASQSL